MRQASVGATPEGTTLFYSLRFVSG